MAKRFAIAPVLLNKQDMGKITHLQYKLNEDTPGGRRREIHRIVASALRMACEQKNGKLEAHLRSIRASASFMFTHADLHALKQEAREIRDFLKNSARKRPALPPSQFALQKDLAEAPNHNGFFMRYRRVSNRSILDRCANGGGVKLAELVEVGAILPSMQAIPVYTIERRHAVGAAAAKIADMAAPYGSNAAVITEAAKVIGNIQTNQSHYAKLSDAEFNGRLQMAVNNARIIIQAAGRRNQRQD